MMTEMKYGEFSKTQLDELKTSLHKKLFQMLLYKDPKTASKYTYVNVDKYIQDFLKDLAAVNSVLFYPQSVIDLIIKVESARLLLLGEDFDYKTYRKLLFEAHNLVDLL